MAAKPLTKNVTETERFGFDYSARLEGETISGCTMTALPADVIISSPAIVGNVVSALVAGGAAGDYALACQIVTSGGRTLRETATLRVTE